MDLCLHSLFFQLVWAGPVPIESVGIVGKGWLVMGRMMRGVGLGGAVGLGGQNPVEGDGGAACSSCCSDLPLGWNRPQIWNLNNGSGPTWWACSHGHRPVSNMCRIRTWGGKTFKVLIPKVFFFFFYKVLFPKGTRAFKAGDQSKAGAFGGHHLDANHKPRPSLSFSRVSLCTLQAPGCGLYLGR